MAGVVIGVMGRTHIILTNVLLRKGVLVYLFSVFKGWRLCITTRALSVEPLLSTSTFYVCI